MRCAVLSDEDDESARDLDREVADRLSAIEDRVQTITDQLDALSDLLAEWQRRVPGAETGGRLPRSLARWCRRRR
jgi:hypothetical protein